MSSRERQASGGATLAARPAPAPVRAASTPADHQPATWEDLFRCLPEAGQQELLALAGRQGLLHAHQLPPVDPALSQQRRQLLAQLLTGKVRDLAPLTPNPVAVLDEALDSCQREAVARALATPDVCLIQGLPGSGKSRVAAEIVSQAAARGDRVLLLAAGPAGLDRVLEQVGRRDSLWPVRHPQPGETLESLPPCIRPFVPEERSRVVREMAAQATRAQLQAAEQLRQRQSERATWDRLTTLAAELAQVEDGRTALESLRVLAPQDIPQALQSSPFAGELKTCLELRDGECERVARERASLQQKREAIVNERAPLVSERDGLHPLLEARRQGQWWNVTFWKARFQTGLQERDDELSRQLAELDQQSVALAEQERQFDKDRESVNARCEEQCRQLLERETARRQEEFTRAGETLRQQWDEACAALLPGSPRPVADTVEAVEQVRSAWEALLKQDERQADFTARWVAALEEVAPALAGQLLASANLVATTFAALATDTSPQSFDLLVVEEAELMNEAELMRAARAARRWVLIGEPDAPVPARTPRTFAPRTGPFHRLCQVLHASPRALPFRWSRSESRLCCRLRPVPDDLRSSIQSEPVVDCPEIELFILAPPRQEPQLVEVHFPLTTPAGEAKSFILRELQEVAAHARGSAFVWSTAPDALLVQMGDVVAEAWQGYERACLEEGVCEVVRTGDDRTAFETLGFEFSLAAGWTRARAESWLGKHLNFHDLGRTAYLGRLHRSCPVLASFLDASLFRRQGPLLSAAESDGSVRFVAVPSAKDSDGRHPGPSGGAGLETDLTQPASAERLPAEFRNALPRQGLVNYPEALAVVRTLETLLSDDAFRAEASVWQRHQFPATCGRADTPADACQGRTATHSPVIVLTALYESQVRLLRTLVNQSAPLRQAGLTRLGEGRFHLPGADALDIVVESPPGLRQRECLVLLLSLTRSHSHRAVAFGEQPGWLPLALTRACGRLLLLGDPGTLARRTQWHGAVDHLDETAGERERELIDSLLRCLPEAEGSLSPPPAAESARR